MKNTHKTFVDWRGRRNEKIRAKIFGEDCILKVLNFSREYFVGDLQNQETKSEAVSFDSIPTVSIMNN